MSILGVVFTLPAPIAEVAFQNKAVVYDILFKAVAQTLRTIAADPEHLGAQLGLVAVLHTWGQTLGHHPHVHCVVPGGGPSLDGTRWVSCRPGFSCARPPPAPQTTSATPSPKSSTPTAPKSAPTTSPTQDMTEPKIIPL